MTHLTVTLGKHGIPVMDIVTAPRNDPDAVDRVKRLDREYAEAVNRRAIALAQLTAARVENDRALAEVVRIDEELLQARRLLMAQERALA